VIVRGQAADLVDPGMAGVPPPLSLGGHGNLASIRSNGYSDAGPFGWIATPERVIDMDKSKLGPNRKQRRANGGKGRALNRAKDAYIVSYGMARQYGSNSPEFESAFAAFAIAHDLLTDPEAVAFHHWQQTHVVALNLQTGELEAVNPASWKPQPKQGVDADVVEWFKEVDAGKRVPQVLEDVPLGAVRPNPFVFEYDEEALADIKTSVGKGKLDAWLVVASLPDGSFVDVDTPYPCEALKRMGRAAVKVTVLGSFDVDKCSEIGLSPWAGEGRG
jgi:hypothetical protein